MKSLVLALFRGYQRYISPAFPPSCRFHPCCSQYGLEAVERFGVLEGGWLTLKRLARCHPFHRDKTMVVDPVPLNTKSNH